MSSSAESAGGTARTPSLRAIRRAHQNELGEAQSDFAIRTKEDVALFLTEHIVPYVTRLEALTGAPAGQINKYMTVHPLYESEQSIEVEIGTQVGNLPLLEVNIMDAEPMDDGEIEAEWEAIVESELPDIIDYRAYEDGDEADDDDEGDTMTLERGMRLMGELSMPILRYATRYILLKEGEAPTVSLELGYMTDGKRYAAFEQDMENQANRTLIGSNPDELALFAEFGAQLSREVDVDDYRRLMRALGIMGITATTH